MQFVRRHKRGLLATLLVLSLVTVTWAADTKLSALSVLGSASVDADDAIYIVDDPNGVPAGYKVGRHEFLLNWTGSANITTLGTLATGTWQATAVDHERGGLEADVSAYAGLVSITGGATAQVDELSELLSALTDVTAFITDDDMPAVAADPDVDAAGEIGRDSDGANETGDSSLRGYDGANQFLYSRKLKTINFTLIEPDGIDAADLIPVWHNTSGMTFTIVEWKAWSDDDDVSFELEELTDQTDFTAITTIDACEVATDGTSVYYASDSTITHAAIEHDHTIAVDFDTSDTPDYLLIAITGWYNSDVN
jgi:hypothetical protein